MVHSERWKNGSYFIIFSVFLIRRINRTFISSLALTDRVVLACRGVFGRFNPTTADPHSDILHV
jgi:hypothetical protein